MTSRRVKIPTGEKNDRIDYEDGGLNADNIYDVTPEDEDEEIKDQLREESASEESGELQTERVLVADEQNKEGSF